MFYSFITAYISTSITALLHIPV